MSKASRVVIVLTLVLITGSGGMLGGNAQDSNAPVSQATPERGESERRLSPYAFYPSEVAHTGGDLPGDPSVQLVKVADGLFEPVNVAAPHDGSGRIFVLERVGVVRIIDADGAILPDPFLDVAYMTEYQYMEQGLLGLAFHPDYSSNGLFYINYTSQRRNGDVLTVQYQVSSENPNKANPDSALIVSERDQPFPSHVGGDIVFGPDGYLYISHGDGGLEGDPFDAGQDLKTHLGKILRIDVTPAVRAASGETLTQAPVGGMAYTIPPDNPFAQGDVIIDLNQMSEEELAWFHPYARPEIWAFGLRNPWQFSFDRQTGDLWIADVGQNFWEEINFEPAGGAGGVNYGWSFLQGAHCFPYSMDWATDSVCPKVGTLPVAEFHHAGAYGADDPGEGCSVVGGSVYRGMLSPSLNGIYFNSDFCTGKIWGLARDANGAWQYQELLDTGLTISGAGEDEKGELYFTSCECVYGQTAPTQGGALWKLVATDEVPVGAEIAGSGSGPLSSSDDATPAVGDIATPEPSGDITIEMIDVAFIPAEISIPANTDVRIVLPNAGAVVHNFNVDELGIHSEDAQPGQSAEVVINAPPGEYRFYCSVPGHREAGMVGILRVQ